MQNAVKIGPSFFAKAKNDYSDWRWAWVRELAQNSMDAPGTDLINFEFSREGGYTVASCTNNGKPMTRDVLTNIFLALGETGKGFDGTIGGFGKAKELIAFTHLRYTIRTGDMLIEGSGAMYNITEGLEYFCGTKTTVWMDDDEVDALEAKAKRFCRMTQWSGTITVNGEQRNTRLRKGAARRDLGFAKVYTNNTLKGYVIVRSGGMPMFSYHTEVDKCVVVELKKPKRGSEVDRQVLASNRDSLRYPYANQLNDFLVDLVVNKRKALRSRTPRYVRYRGAKLTYRTPAIVSNIISEVMAEARPTQPALLQGAAPGLAASGSAVAVAPGAVPLVAPLVVGSEPMESTEGEVMDEGRYHYEEEEVVAVSLGSEFVIKNESDMRIPEYYLPDSGKFSTYSRKLVKMWAKVLLELHQLLKHESTFGVGFIFDDADDDGFIAAQYEQNGPFGEVYYINPARVVRQKSGSRSFTKRLALTDRDAILADAVHEVVHGMGYHSHDESYAGRLTDAFAVVMKHRRRFNKCFRV